MTIRRFFDKQVIIKRLKTISGNRKNFVATATAEGAIQELDREGRVKLGLVNEERIWIGWFDLDEDIHEGDTITDEQGVRYNVREVTRKDYGANQHLQILMAEHND